MDIVEGEYVVSLLPSKSRVMLHRSALKFQSSYATDWHSCWRNLSQNLYLSRTTLFCQSSKTAVQKHQIQLRKRSCNFLILFFPLLSDMFLSTELVLLCIWNRISNNKCDQIPSSSSPYSLYFCSWWLYMTFGCEKNALTQCSQCMCLEICLLREWA